MFLHGGWIHLGMNMWMLWIFGNNVEDRLGRSCISASIWSADSSARSASGWPTRRATMPMIGASGAVAAVLGGYAITYPKAMVKTLIFFGLILIRRSAGPVGAGHLVRAADGRGAEHFPRIAGRRARRLLGPHRRLRGRRRSDADPSGSARRPPTPIGNARSKSCSASTIRACRKTNRLDRITHHGPTRTAKTRSDARPVAASADGRRVAAAVGRGGACLPT